MHSWDGERVFVLTGAGISAESGLATFRDSDGLWAGYRIEEVCTPQAWESDPERVWQFYGARRAAAAGAEPNAAHRALAALEARLGEEFFLCTQNVDDLHERAGSKRMVHMHGELFEARCSAGCGRAPVEDRAAYGALSEVARCGCGAVLRPHIVFFGEMPLQMERIEAELRKATVMLVVGTSGAVYPAAGFVRAFRNKGRNGLGVGRTVYVGLEPPLNAAAFDEVVVGRAGEVLPGLVGGEQGRADGV